MNVESLFAALVVGSRHRLGECRDVYLLCLDDLLPCGKHSSQWRFIIQQ